GLAGPDGHERVPVVRRGNGNSINRFVLEQLANVNKSLWLGLASVEPGEPFRQHVFVNVTKRHNLDVGEPQKPLKVILATAMQAADGAGARVAGSKSSFRTRKKFHALKRRQSRRSLNTISQEISAFHFGSLVSHRFLLAIYFTLSTNEG